MAGKRGKRGSTGASLAIDQGTTSTKAYRGNPAGDFTAIGTRTHRQIHPWPGWVEHDPMELLTHISSLIEAAGPVTLAGLANQGETVVAWDARTKRPLANAIVWQDQRTQAEIDRLRADGVEALTLARAGLPLDPYFSASKLRWLAEHADGARDLLREGRLRLGTSDAFFLDCLTGVFATDVSTASRTSLLDLRSLQWDPVLCDVFGVPIECLPEIRPTVGDFGTLPGGAALVVNAVDQQASLFGHGCRGPGDIKITFGTGAFALGLTGAAPLMQQKGGLLPTCAWRVGKEAAQYALDGGILTAGAALEWVRGLGLVDDFTALDRLGGQSAAARGLFFVPAQTGLGCPYWDRSARGSWLGLGLDTSREDLARAVLEGIALRAAQLVRTFADVTGTATTRISVDGGLTRNPYFTRFLAGALGQAVSVATIADVTAIGLLHLCGATCDPASTLKSEISWREATPAGGDFGAIHARFANAVERTRGWATEA
jgi:glycerol kinase